MPELAEVEHHRRRWDPGLRGKILAVQLHPGKRIFRGLDAGALAERLTGQTLLESTAHGKQMLFRLSGGHWLGVHLGMTGELQCRGPSFSQGPHDHLVLQQARRALVFSDPRLFGRIRFHQGATPPGWWTSLPPAILSREFTVERMKAFLQRRARSPIKAVLLSQECFLGIGNWMADEILWRAGFHPTTLAGRLALPATARRLWTEVRWVTAGALRIVTPDYADPPPAWLFRHRWRDGGICPRDATRLQRAEIGGRTTAWCPTCQPRRAPPATGGR